jgi:hypothetical protein
VTRVQADSADTRHRRGCGSYAVAIADLLRCAPLASAVILLETGRPADALVAMLMVVPALLIRGTRAPLWLDMTLTSLLGIHFIAVAEGLLDAWPAEDNVAHVVLPFLTAPVVYAALLRLGTLSEPLHRVPPQAAGGMLAAVGACVLGLGALWELFEWTADGVLGTNMSLGYEDTLTDLLADAAGALLGAVWVALDSRRLEPSPRPPSVLKVVLSRRRGAPATGAELRREAAVSGPTRGPTSS